MAIESITQAHIDRLGLAGPPSAKTERVYLDPRQRDYPDVGAGSPTFTQVSPWGDDLVGYWPLNDDYIDGTDYKYKDVSGNAHHATANELLTSAEGPAGPCVDLDGTQYLTVADHADWDFGTGDFSWVLWFKLDQLASDLARSFRIVDRGGGTGGGVLYSQTGSSADKAIFALNDAAASTQYLVSNSELVADTQYHIAVVRTSGVVRMFLNGVLQTSSITADIDISSAAGWGLGSTNSGATPMDGKLAHARIYNRALTQAEVTTLYAAAPGPALTHNVPGSHYLSGGYSEHLVTLPDTFTIQVKFKPGFAFDTASDQNLFGYDVSATQVLRVYYIASLDLFRVVWLDNGTPRDLRSAQYDDGTSYRNIDAWMTLTASIDLTTGDTTGSALWMDSTQDDTAWSGAIDSKSTTFGKMQIRAYNGTAGAYDIAYVKLWPNLTISALSDLDTTKAEEIYWCMDGHPVGRTRCNVTSYVHSVEVEYSRNNPFSGAHSSSKASIGLRNTSGEFSDDQYAAFNPVNGVYNGLVTDKFLQNRNRVWIESHYSGDWDNVIVGQITQGGFARNTTRDEVGIATIKVDDAVALLAEKRVAAAEAFVGDELVSATLADSLLHQIVKLGSLHKVRNYAADSSVAGTIGNSYLVTGGTLTQQADGYFGANCAQLANASGTAQQLYSTITFAGDELLNVGDVFTLAVWLKSAAAATQTVRLSEQDSVGQNDFTDATYTLAGGEGYVKQVVTHTITDSDSDRLRWLVYVDNGATIKVDGVHVYRRARELYYYAANTTEGTAGVISADEYAESEYETIGTNLEAVNITHPWRRVETNSLVWNNAMSIAEASGAIYFGMDKNNTLQGVFYLGDTYTDPVVGRIIKGQRSDGTYALPKINTNIEVATANKIIGRGVILRTSGPTEMLWSARATDVFNLNTNTGWLNEAIAIGEAWPTDDYGITFASYGRVSLEGEYRYDPIPTKRGPVSEPGAGSRKREEPSGFWYTKARQGYVRDVVGVTVPILRHRLSDNTDGLTQTTEFLTAGDWATLRADAARIELVNGTGVAKTLVDCYLVGKRVIRLAGENGLIHDAFEDRADIERNGERVFEFGNDDVVTSLQLRKLAQYSWDYHKDKKHIYSATLPGTRYDMTPGIRRYVLEIGAAGQTEYIDSTVEVLYMKTKRTVGGAAQTMVTLREVEENWKFTSNALVRVMANSNTSIPTEGTPTIIVASATHASLSAHLYCDGTDDQTEIQAAIDFLSETFGGGTVVFTLGTYSISAAIEGKANIKLIGQGSNTVVNRNASDTAIECIGTLGSEVSGFEVASMTLTRADATAFSAFNFSYADDLILRDVTIGSFATGIGMGNCDGATFDNIRIVNPEQYGVWMSATCDGSKLANISIDGQQSREAGLLYGMRLWGTRLTIVNCTIRGLYSSADQMYALLLFSNGLNMSNITIEDCDNDQAASAAYGCVCQGSDVVVSNLRIIDIDNSGDTTTSTGIEVTGDNNAFTSLIVTGCDGTGVLIAASADKTQIAGGRSTSNGTNYTNSGTNTSTSSFDTT